LFAPSLPQRVRQNLATSGLPVHRCQIEVTETSPLYDSQIAAKNMTELKAIGVKLALDDFGTGHANLNYLLKYPFDTLKIDKEFVTALSPTPDRQRLLRVLFHWRIILVSKFLPKGGNPVPAGPVDADWL
jgi:EAL domain-containing protein (putative c-di-GMP-specific phosphodiesterase class I)